MRDEPLDNESAPAVAETPSVARGNDRGDGEAMTLTYLPERSESGWRFSEAGASRRRSEGGAAGGVADAEYWRSQHEAEAAPTARGRRP